MRGGGVSLVHNILLIVCLKSLLGQSFRSQSRPRGANASGGGHHHHGSIMNLKCVGPNNTNDI